MKIRTFWNLSYFSYCFHSWFFCTFLFKPLLSLHFSIDMSRTLLLKNQRNFLCFFFFCLKAAFPSFSLLKATFAALSKWQLQSFSSHFCSNVYVLYISFLLSHHFWNFRFVSAFSSLFFWNVYIFSRHISFEISTFSSLFWSPSAQPLHREKLPNLDSPMSQIPLWNIRRNHYIASSNLYTLACHDVFAVSHTYLLKTYAQL